MSTLDLRPPTAILRRIRWCGLRRVFSFARSEPERSRFRGCTRGRLHWGVGCYQRTWFEGIRYSCSVVSGSAIQGSIPGKAGCAPFYQRQIPSPSLRISQSDSRVWRYDRRCSQEVEFAVLPPVDAGWGAACRPSGLRVPDHNAAASFGRYLWPDPAALCRFHIAVSC